MASLSEFPQAVRRVGTRKFFRTLAREISGDYLTVLAAALAYAWLFAIFPFFVFLLSLLPYLPRDVTDPVESNLTQYIDATLPHNAAGLRAALDGVLHEHKTGLLSLGLLVTLWSASSGVAMTMAGLDLAYDVPQRPTYKQRPLAIALTLVLAVLIVLVLLLLPIGSVVIDYARDHGQAILQRHHWSAKWLFPILLAGDVVRYGVAILLLFAVLAIVYHFGPNVRQRFRAVTPGAVFCVAVWLILGAAFRTYVDKFGRYEKTYGTLGGAAILLLFFYVDGLMLLIGAEINSVIDLTMHGQKGERRRSKRDRTREIAKDAAGAVDEDCQPAAEAAAERAVEQTKADGLLPPVEKADDAK